MAIISCTHLTTKYGEFKVCYHECCDKDFAISLSRGDLTLPGAIVRVHSSCLFSEALHSLDCDCNMQLERAMDIIARENKGTIIYLYQEGRGVGLANKIKSMELERVKGIDTTEAFTELHFDLDPRRYEIAIAALNDLKINKNIRLITNNPRKVAQLRAGGFIINGKVTLKYPVSISVRKYLKVKREKLGHDIDNFLLEGVTNK